MRPVTWLIGTLAFFGFGTIVVPFLAYVVVTAHLRATYQGGDLRGVVEIEDPIFAIVTALGVAIGAVGFASWARGAHDWPGLTLRAAGIAALIVAATAFAWLVLFIPIALFFALGTYPGSTGPDPWVFRLPTVLVIALAAALGGQALARERLGLHALVVLAAIVAPVGLFFDALVLSSPIAIGPALGASFGVGLVLVLLWRSFEHLPARNLLVCASLVYAVAVPLAMSLPKEAVRVGAAEQKADSERAADREGLMAAGGPPPGSCAGEMRGLSASPAEAKHLWRWAALDHPRHDAGKATDAPERC